VEAGAKGRVLAAGLTALAVGWTLVIVAAPNAAEGRAPLVAAIVYQAGSRICHQRPERSFHIGGTQMPVCARCFGLYSGGAAGLVLAWGLRRRWSSRTLRAILMFGALPIALTVAFEWLRLIETSNMLRWLTGLPLGLVAGLGFFGLLRGPD
jgi:uncharacterized membrane protein